MTDSTRLRCQGSFRTAALPRELVGAPRIPVFTIGGLALACSTPAPDQKPSFGPVEPQPRPTVVASASVSASADRPAPTTAPSSLEPRAGERLCVVERDFRGTSRGELSHFRTAWTFQDSAGRTLRIVVSSSSKPDLPDVAYTMRWGDDGRLASMVETRPEGDPLETKLTWSDGALLRVDGPAGSHDFEYLGAWHASKQPAPNAAVEPPEDAWFTWLTVGPPPWLPFTGDVVDQYLVDHHLETTITARYDEHGYWMGQTLEGKAENKEEEVVRAEDGRILEHRRKGHTQGQKLELNARYTYKGNRVVAIVHAGLTARYAYADDGRLATRTIEMGGDRMENRFERFCAERTLSSAGW